jgi:hypothetical protein
MASVVVFGGQTRCMLGRGAAVRALAALNTVYGASGSPETYQASSRGARLATARLPASAPWVTTEARSPPASACAVARLPPTGCGRTGGSDVSCVPGRPGPVPAPVDFPPSHLVPVGRAAAEATVQPFGHDSSLPPLSGGFFRSRPCRATTVKRLSGSLAVRLPGIPASSSWPRRSMSTMTACCAMPSASRTRGSGPNCRDRSGRE